MKFQIVYNSILSNIILQILLYLSAQLFKEG